ncbi:hypothetical protein LSUE1_G008639 [Lachnellula suecica]|uniref:Rhodopsin domain-containing protein n=1 Tax=Lachnellula suecica TaxID=602035 RepID=A0A8T9BS21_9HELO|nr:hypothetical protein LSUE1_G008639 [Lachnellula suecica]
MSLSPAELQAYLNGPAYPLPPGVEPNFTNPHNFKSIVLTIGIIFLVFPTLAIFIRLYTKLWLIGRMHWEDWAMLVGWGIFIGTFVVTVLGRPYGAATHQWNVQLKDLSHYLYYLHLGAVMYGCCIFAVKLSILLQYLRVFTIPKERGLFFWSCHAMIWLDFVFYAACFFLEIFSCKPLAGAWDPIVAATARCLNVNTLNTASAAVNSVSDIVILILPQPIIWNLNMSFRKKLGLSAIFSTGLLACIASAVRIYYGVKLASTGDYTWYASVFASIVPIEIGFGIITGCLPVLPKFSHHVTSQPIFQRLGNSLRSLRSLLYSKGSRQRGNGSSTSGDGAGKPWTPSSDSKLARPNSYVPMPDAHELSLVSDGEGTTGGSKVNSKTQIMRTVDITMDSKNPDENSEGELWKMSQNRVKPWEYRNEN